VCIDCGAEFEIIEKPRHNDQISRAPALSSDIKHPVETYDVARVHYQRWEGRHSATTTMRVDYHGPFMRIASEWVCFEHTGYAREKAVHWWAKRAPGTPIPKTIDEAVARSGELQKPASITVKQAKYPEVLSYVWPENESSREAARNYGAEAHAQHSRADTRDHALRGVQSF
jgi:DNA repair protein RadD